MEKAMETVVALVKYIFVAGVAVEVALILRALFTLARDKARAANVAEAPAQPMEK
jgi:hypothetical protein